MAGTAGSATAAVASPSVPPALVSGTSGPSSGLTAALSGLSDTPSRLSERLVAAGSAGGAASSGGASVCFRPAGDAGSPARCSAAVPFPAPTDSVVAVSELSDRPSRRGAAEGPSGLAVRAPGSAPRPDGAVAGADRPTGKDGAGRSATWAWVRPRPTAVAVAISTPPAAPDTSAGDSSSLPGKNTSTGRSPTGRVGGALLLGIRAPKPRPSPLRFSLT